MGYGYYKMGKNMMEIFMRIKCMEMEYTIVKKELFKPYGNKIYQLKLLKDNELYVNE